MFTTMQEARAAYLAHRDTLNSLGIADMVGKRGYTPDAWKNKAGGFSAALAMDSTLAYDAQPGLSTTASAGIPWFMVNYVDPAIYQVLFAPVEAAKILGEERKGSWTTATAMFPIVEHTGETSSYGDYANNGESNLNSNFPQRQNYRYQTIKQYGELEIEMAGEARISWVSELDKSAANNMMRFENFMYFFGIANLENYGLLNDPNLPGAQTPAPKAYGGTTWFVGNQLKATPNEVYNDVLACYYQLVQQTAGIVNEKTKLVLATSPQSAVAFKAANSFGVNTYELLEENLPNIRFESAVQYGALSASNPQGVAGGNFMQLIAEDLEGQKCGFCAFSEKMRSHPIIRDMSAFKQKVSGGGYGTVIRLAAGFSSMLGI